MSSCALPMRAGEQVLTLVRWGLTMAELAGHG